jgi:hypothetical protein
MFHAGSTDDTHKKIFLIRIQEPAERRDLVATTRNVSINYLLLVIGESDLGF